MTSLEAWVALCVLQGGKSSGSCNLLVHQLTYWQ